MRAVVYTRYGGPDVLHVAEVPMPVPGDQDVLIWTTPTRWAAGDGLTLRLPRLGLDLSCTLEDGRLAARSMALSPNPAPDPREEAGSVGALLSVPDVEAPVQRNGSADPTGRLLAEHFERHGRDRWVGFSELLREAVNAAPDYQPARWMLGQLRVGDEWLAVEEAQRRAAADRIRPTMPSFARNMAKRPRGSLRSPAGAVRTDWWMKPASIGPAFCRSMRRTRKRSRRWACVGSKVAR